MRRHSSNRVSETGGRWVNDPDRRVESQDSRGMWRSNGLFHRTLESFEKYQVFHLSPRDYNLIGLACGLDT